jgi:hypothetical protein
MFIMGFIGICGIGIGIGIAFIIGSSSSLVMRPSYARA